MNLALRYAYLVVKSSSDISPTRFSLRACIHATMMCCPFIAPKQCCFATNGSYSWQTYPEQHLHYANRRLQTRSLYGPLKKVPPSAASHCLDQLLPLYKQWVKVSKVLSEKLHSQPIECTSPSPIVATDNDDLSLRSTPDGCDQSKLQPATTSFGL